jgi:YVTN family beta-propeller protein
MKRSICCIFLATLFLAQRNISIAQNTINYHIIHTFHIASSGKWDFIALDPGSNKLYQSHGTQVNILDRTTGDSLGVILNTTGVHGIAFADELGKGYTSNGKTNTVTVFDLKTDSILNRIATGQDPDDIVYEAYSKKIITCNAHSNDLSIIDPVTDKVIATVSVEGNPERVVSNDKGKIYVNIESKNEIAVINIKTFTVEAYWPLTPGEAPSGLAIDKKTNRLFSGCADTKLLVIVDADNGKLIDTFPMGARCDAVGFDPIVQDIYASCGDGTLTIVHEVSKDKFVAVEKINTKKGAKTMAVDEKTHRLYLPTADFEPLPLNSPETTKPKIIPGTFQILVIEK